MGEIFERPFPPRALEWTGERLTGDTSGQTEIEHLHRYFFARSLCRDLDVLDIASGEGYGSAMMAQVARSVIGVEIDEATVRHASEAYGRPNLQYRQGDARNIPLPDACVDVVVSFETLEHFFEHDNFMSEIRRVLRPGGFVVISSPERDIYSPAGGTPNPYHVHELTHSEFDHLLRRHFGHVALYGQRPLLGAALIPEFAPAAEALPFLTFERRDHRLFEVSTGLPRSIYLVGIASDVPVPLGRGSLFVETSGVEAIFARDLQAREEQKRLTDRLIEEGDYAQRVQAELNRRDEQLATKVVEARDWHQQLVQRNEQFAELEAALVKSNNTLAEVKQREDAVHLELNKERLLHSGTQVQLRALQQTILNLRQTIVDRREQYNALQAVVRQMEGEQQTLREVVRSSRALLEHKESEFAVLEAHTDSLVRDLVSMTQAKLVAETELQAVHQSFSWRVTRPIRVVLSRHPRIRRLVRGSARRAWRLLMLRALRSAPLSALPPETTSSQEPPSTQLAPPGIALTNTLKPSEFEPSQVTFSPRPIPLPPAPDPEALPHGQGRRLLFVSHVLPFPTRAGNEYRIHRLLDWLAREDWRVTLVVCPLPGEALSETRIAQLAAVYPDLIICQHDGTVLFNQAEKSDFMERLRGVAPRTLSVLLGEENAPAQQTRIIELQRTFCPDPVAEFLLRLDEELQPHVFLAEYIFMTRPFALLRSEVLKIVDTIDVFSTKASKVEKHGVSDGLALSEEEETLLLRRADILIGIQPEEAADLARLSPDNRVLSIGVDFPVIEHVESLPLEPVALLVASGNPMNVKGILDFLEYAWPLVRQAVPRATLRVVGPIGQAINTPPEGVEIVGLVDLLAPEYAAARVAINPAIAGTGLKIKTVEALCHLRPIVTWPAGIDGIGSEALPFCHVVTHWFGFAQSLIELLTNDDKAGAIGNARDALAHALSPEQVYAPLRHAIDQGR